MEAHRTIAAHGARWRVSAVCPPDWRSAIESCGGGFFHTPVGLRLSVPDGEARFLEYVTESDELLAIAIASVRRCSFTSRPRHAAFPTWPAMRNHADWPGAIQELRVTLRELDIAEAVIDSFDADGGPEDVNAQSTRSRREFRLPLAVDAESMLARCSPNHRRQIRRGEKQGWEFRFLHGGAAHDAVAAVQDGATARASERGDGFEAARPTAEAWSASGFSDGWGSCTVGAFQNSTLLSAAVIGWANRRAFYVVGGSTDAGYSAGSAPWLHWRAMSAFRDAGGLWYNLGGTPHDAEREDAPSHGLHRFKSGFGAERCLRSGAHWEISPSHLRSHAAARWVKSRVKA